MITNLSFSKDQKMKALAESISEISQVKYSNIKCQILVQATRHAGSDHITSTS